MAASSLRPGIPLAIDGHYHGSWAHRGARVTRARRVRGRPFAPRNFPADISESPAGPATSGGMAARTSVVVETGSQASNMHDGSPRAAVSAVILSTGRGPVLYYPSWFCGSGLCPSCGFIGRLRSGRQGDKQARDAPCGHGGSWAGGAELDELGCELCLLMRGCGLVNGQMPFSSAVPVQLPSWRRQRTVVLAGTPPHLSSVRVGLVLDASLDRDVWDGSYLPRGPWISAWK